MRAGPAGRTAAERNSDRAVDRDTNSTRNRASACPDLDDYHRQVTELGFRISRRGIERFWVLYSKTYADDNFLTYLMSYLDPTGETAVNEVLSGRVA